MKHTSKQPTPIQSTRRTLVQTAWITPLITTAALSTHAQTSEIIVTCTDQTVECITFMNSFDYETWNSPGDIVTGIKLTGPEPDETVYFYPFQTQVVMTGNQTTDDAAIAAQFTDQFLTNVWIDYMSNIVGNALIFQSVEENTVDNYGLNYSVLFCGADQTIIINDLAPDFGLGGVGELANENQQSIGDSNTGSNLTTMTLCV